jgi:hypothetical protein
MRPNVGVCYRGVWIDVDGNRVQGIIPVEDVAPGPDPIWGFYNVETGEQEAA